MIIEPTQDEAIITSIITEPKLWKLEYGQGMAIKDYEVDGGFTYLLIKENETILGLFQTRELTRILLEAHIYLLPEYWGGDSSKKALTALIEYCKTNTTYHKVFTDVPKVCKHVINLMKRIGAVQCGYIQEGVIFDGKLTDLMLFSKKVR